MYDNSEEKRRPMFHYLLSSRLAKIFDSSESTRGLAASSTGKARPLPHLPSPTSAFTATFARASICASAEEWARQARNLMRQHLYQIASICYEKADDEHGMLEALGMHYFHQTASSATDGRPADRMLRAARCFELAGGCPLPGQACRA